MAQSKGPRISVSIECSECRNTQAEKRSPGVSRYLTSKNRRNTTEKLALLKHCKYCNKHTLHKETK
jgi:large subunit ribosomal protein L33